MEKQHPHFGAVHKIAEQSDSTFAVEVTIPGASMVTVSGFTSEADAATWIDRHEREIATGTMARAKLHLWKKDT